jgi:hypothetical protein
MRCNTLKKPKGGCHIFTHRKKANDDRGDLSNVKDRLRGTSINTEEQ